MRFDGDTTPLLLILLSILLLAPLTLVINASLHNIQLDGNGYDEDYDEYEEYTTSTDTVAKNTGNGTLNNTMLQEGQDKLNETDNTYDDEEDKYGEENSIYVPSNGSEDEEGGEREEEEGEEDEGGEELAESLGSAAWNLGIPLIFGFVAYKYTYIALIKRKIKLPLSLATALKIHVVTSLVLGAAALLHGAMLIEYAGPVELAAAGLVALITVSGIILYYSKGKTTRYARLIHAQRILGILVLLTVALHVALID